MVKAYLRYEHAAAFGVIASDCNVVHVGAAQVATGAAEAVLLWNLRQGQEVARMEAPRGANDAAAPRVTCLALSSTRQLAAGYSDGTIRLWDLARRECTATLTGHKHAVSCLRFSADGARLASGGRDTNINLWDVAGEAGLFKLRGHKGMVTDLAFASDDGVLLSCSKDSYLRVWDLATQHCRQSVVGHRGEVWSLDVSPDGRRAVTGSADAEVRVYRVGEAGEGEEPPLKRTREANEAGPGPAGDDLPDVLHFMGSLRRKLPDRVASVRFSSRGDLLCVASAGKGFEVFRVRDRREVHLHVKRRQKRGQKKREGEGDGAAEPDAGLVASDELAPLHEVRTKGKVVAAAFAPEEGKAREGELGRVTVVYSNNSVECWAVAEDGAERGFGVQGPGHRSDVRALALSADDSLLLSTSNAGAKVWNPRTGKCLRSVDEVGYGLSAMFLPGGRHAAVGTKGGQVELVDVAAGEVVARVDAHEGPVWSVCLTPDRSGFLTGSADKDVKAWELEVVEEGGQARLGCRHTRTLRLSDDVLCVRCSPDGRLVACALLDATVKVFFLDTFKFYLSLYGHKLPVLCMDISSDSTLLLSGSADKSVRVWGLDFGDCHRTLRAHRDSVMQAAFVPRTHFAFTCGRDGTLCYWDCDKFEKLLVLDGHFGEAWALAVSGGGDMVVTGGHDRSLRRWERTDEPFFVEEEKERRLESMWEEGAGGDEERRKDDGAAGATDVAGTRSSEVVTSADAIIDALDMAAVEEKRLAEHDSDGQAGPFQPNPLLLGLPPGEYVLRRIAGVRAADLEQALLVVPFHDAVRILRLMPSWMDRRNHLELCVRVTNLLLRIHHRQLSASPETRTVLLALQGRLRPRVQSAKDCMGFNCSALEHLKRRLAASQVAMDEMGLAIPSEGALGGRRKKKAKAVTA